MEDYADDEDVLKIFENKNLRETIPRQNFKRKSTMTANDLTDESKLRKSISFSDIESIKEDNYIKAEDWDYLQNEAQGNLLEENFKKFEEKFFSNFFSF